MRTAGDPRRRLVALVAALAAWGLLVAARSVDIGLVRQDEFRRRAALQQEREMTFQPRRGEILDRFGQELAISVPAASVVADPTEITHPGEVAGALAPILGLDPLRVLDKLREDRSFVYLARRIDLDHANRIRDLDLEGIHIVPDTRRVYPKGKLASQVLGLVGVDNDGLAGLEYQYDDDIKGRPGNLVLLRDARTSSHVRIWKAMVQDEPVDGRTLRLTLDASLQYVVERELDDGARRAHARSASAVVLDPKDGSILALASWPPFDPVRDRDGNPEHWRLRPVMNAYEPGSTFKIVAVASAISHGILEPNDPVDCGAGSIAIAGHLIREVHGKAYGILSLGEALAHSSNVGLVRVGLALGRDNLFQTARGFGFGDRLGVDLPGENPGILRPPAAWSAMSLASLSIGQEVGVTPLQLASAYAAIANGGTLYRPHVMKEIVDSDGQVVRTFAPTPLGRILSEDDAHRMARMLERVVDEGTGQEAGVPGYAVAGKTGTAQKAGPGGYLPDRFVASFVGFVPSRAPRFVLLVVIDEPRGNIYGGHVAAPVFRRIVEWAVAHFDIPPLPSENHRILEAKLDAPLPPRLVAPAGGLIPTSTSNAGPSRVPDLGGLDLRAAVTRLASLGLTATVKGHGRVRRQTPPAGAAPPANGSCTLVLGPDETDEL